MKVFVTGTRGIPDIMGGVETHCEELFPRIVEKGVNVSLVRRSDYVKDSLEEWKGIKLIDIDCPKIKAFEAIIHTYKAINYAYANNGDIIHIHAIGPALLTPYAKMLGLKVIFTHHGPDYDRDKWGLIAKIVLKLGEMMGCIFADHIIVISNVIKDLVNRKYRRFKNVHLVYNGVPNPEFCSSLEYLNELGLKSRRFVFTMCRFVPEKRLHDLIDAYSYLKRNGLIDSDLKLVIAGDADFEDDYSRKLKKQASDNGVILTGFIKGKKLKTLLSEARCYVLPSSHEGLPIALLEAMSYNLPVIVTAIPANLEVGLNPEVYFPVGNKEELRNKLEKELKLPFNKIQYDMSKYNWDLISDKVMDIYSVL